MQHKYLVLLNMTGALSMIMIDQTVLGVVLPSLQRTYEFGPMHMQWAVNAYLLAIASSLMFGGWVGDRFGYFLGFRIGVVLFTLASLACAIAPTGDIFIAFRAVQGLGTGLMQPAAAALIFSSFAAEERGKALATYVGVGLFFLALGPLIGGAFVQYLSWRMVFIVNVPVGTMVFIATLFLGANKRLQNPQSFDFFGAFLFVVSLLVFTVAIQQFGDERMTVGETVLSLVFVGLFMTVIYLRRHRVKHSFIQFSLFHTKVFVGCCLLLFCIPFALLGQVIFGAVFFQNVLGLTALEAGLSMLPVILVTIIISQFSGRLLSKISFRKIALTGTLSMAVGFGAQAYVIEYNKLWLLMPGMIVLGFGLGLVISSVTVVGLSYVVKSMRAQASALLHTCREIGGVFGIACIGGLINWREKKLISEAAELMEPDAEKQELLQLILYKVISDQPIAAALLHERWPESLWVLKAISSRALSDGYTFGALVLLLAAFISIWAFSEEKQSEAISEVQSMPEEKD